MKKVIFVMSVLLIFIAPQVLKAQTPSASATANAKAEIVTPISILKTQDLDFGSIAASSVADQVTIAPNGTRTSGGNVILIAAFPGEQAVFNVSGDPNYAFNITLPGDNEVTITNGSATMEVNSFVCNPTSPSSLDASGSATLNVGATLYVGANQDPGSYTGTFDVIVAYE
jgi:spore coat protein U-like protein